MSDVGPVESLYQPIVESIVQRILIAEDALSQVAKNENGPLNFVECEVAVLQIRLICELFLAGSTAAHANEGGIEISTSIWRPKEVFQSLSKINIHPLQIPVSVELDKNGPGGHHVTPKSRPLKFEVISEIYGKCGDLLHVPTIRQISKGKLPEFDVAVLWRWLGGFRELAMGHALMLPERQTVMLAIWSGDVATKPESFRLDAKGPSSLDLSLYPEFDLL